MQGFKQVIADQSPIDAVLSVGQIFNQDKTAGDCVRQQLQLWLDDYHSSHAPGENSPQQLQQLIDYFYYQLAFSAGPQDEFTPRYILLEQVVACRSGIPLSLALLFASMANQLGFKLCGINFPGHFMLRADFSQHASVYINPLNGKCLSGADLQVFYQHLVGDSEPANSDEIFAPAQQEDILQRFLHNLKNAYIKLEQYQSALMAVDLLIELNEEDPYLRRDRGFLLHQLECTQLAIADYQYFIAQCPQDPASILLEAQIRQLANEPGAVLH